MGDFNDPFMRGNNAAVQARTKQQNRANLMQMKLIGQSHPTGLTNNLLKLFEPRPPLEYKPPPEKRKCPPYTGMAQFVSNFAEPTDPEYAPPIVKGETPGQKKARIHQLRLEEGAKKAAEELEKYDPNNDPNISGDPYKTLFVARLNYETTESRVKREFEAYGPIKRVRLIADKETNKPRGYAFIEYMHTRDMKAAYKQADGRKIDNRRVLVDVERGRTVPNWRPRRLGGGLGTTRVGGEEVNQRVSGREQQSGGPTRSVEPRGHEERDREREKSRERVKEREREKSRERSHDKPRDREHREDRHHRDRDRKSDRDRDRDRSGRDRDRDRHRDRDRDRSGRDRSGRDRDRYRDKDREGDVEQMDRDHEHDRGRSRDKDYEYDRVDRHERDKHGDRQKSYEHGDPEEMYDQPVHGNRVDHERDLGGYDDYYDQERYGHQDRDHDRYYEMEEENYEPGKVDPHEKDHDRSYRQSDRSLSREYEY
ncbi:putative U1 small nuclear ribonucleoprotein of 70kDa [Helianthus annuus]|uniref:Putative U1 small nuclear ribonucleoprotein-70K n=1 Tax=Helianthus annuus TaxID=4232 RepID=A0A251UAQ3_HELAN|nr:U1 small nuclear ribonucleoprotein 70 kDa [Helianthus annuus]KAF5798658.1 putative U1 small nuclear ribonucleoprotein 70kDa [Helianthus annuus]KAJ0556890.1 putative U1 small nuclear ribonucleoprotein of 70kDa [Helianthus annuus]KAJ0904766.1 putative U1 small nuclear ribonucleoprotein 70kDa [Helianthus annuus]KAJ0908023.1 putative U1 small nuclear ribonucleoprotein of 70kDa [Helianthus annuus]